jgi:hypothetical protein
VLACLTAAGLMVPHTRSAPRHRASGPLVEAEKVLQLRRAQQGEKIGPGRASSPTGVMPSPRRKKVRCAPVARMFHHNGDGGHDGGRWYGVFEVRQAKLWPRGVEDVAQPTRNSATFPSG